MLPAPDRGLEVMTQNPCVSVHLLDGLDDPSLDKSVWLNLLGRGETDTIFLTPWWQRAWWQSFARGQLLVLGVFENEELVAIAPLFTDGGMVFFIGSGGSDYLDFIGDFSDVDVLADTLAKAMASVPEFAGFRFYHVPDHSGTGSRLQHAAVRLGLDCYNEGVTPSPMIDLGAVGKMHVQKKSLVRHQRFFERNGTLQIQHFSNADDILPRLEAFFRQHIERWASTPFPSLFLDESQKRFYKLLVVSTGTDTWLRFTEVEWNDTPIAFHFGFNYRGNYMWYKPSFSIEHARRSPGEVLLRNLLFAAMEERATTFDLGLGDEAFKRRFASDLPTVSNWGLYPRSQVDPQDRSLKD